MKITRIHTLRRDRARSIMDATTAKWRTLEFSPHGCDQHRYLDPTIQWSPAMSHLRARLFRVNYPRADQRMRTRR